MIYRPARPAIRAVRRLTGAEAGTGYETREVKYRGGSAEFRLRRFDEGDALAIQQCFVDRQYDMPDGVQGERVDALYRSIVGSGRQPLVIDCGANIGVSVAWFSMRYPEAHIVAIEPSPDNCMLLKHNTTGMNVDVREAGVATEDGEAFLTTTPYGGTMGWQITFEPTDKRVPLVSIQTLLAEKESAHYTPFLLKVDIEGGEAMLFSGDTSAIAQFPLIIMEPHDWMYPGECVSQNFFRFHAATGREFAMKHENVASLAIPR